MYCAAHITRAPQHPSSHLLAMVDASDTANARLVSDWNAHFRNLEVDASYYSGRACGPMRHGDGRITCRYTHDPYDGDPDDEVDDPKHIRAWLGTAAAQPATIPHHHLFIRMHVTQVKDREIAYRLLEQLRTIIMPHSDSQSVVGNVDQSIVLKWMQSDYTEDKVRILNHVKPQFDNHVESLRRQYIQRVREMRTTLFKAIASAATDIPKQLLIAQLGRADNDDTDDGIIDDDNEHRTKRQEETVIGKTFRIPDEFCIQTCGRINVSLLLRENWMETHPKMAQLVERLLCITVPATSRKFTIQQQPPCDRCGHVAGVDLLPDRLQPGIISFGMKRIVAFTNYELFDMFFALDNVRELSDIYNYTGGDPMITFDDDGFINGIQSSWRRLQRKEPTLFPNSELFWTDTASAATTVGRTKRQSAAVMIRIPLEFHAARQCALEYGWSDGDGHALLREMIDGIGKFMATGTGIIYSRHGILEAGYIDNNAADIAKVTGAATAVTDADKDGPIVFRCF